MKRVRFKVPEMLTNGSFTTKDSVQREGVVVEHADENGWCQVKVKVEQVNKRKDGTEYKTYPEKIFNVKKEWFEEFV